MTERSSAVLSRYDEAGERIKEAFERHSVSRGPRYLCLHSAVTDLIDGGHLQPGQQLPPDDAIARLLEISVGTVQKAMHALREDELLERRQGAGTFVIDTSVEMHNLWQFRFIGEDQGAYLPLSAKAYRRTEITEGGPWRDYMPDVASFILISRKINVNGEFSIYSDFYFHGTRFPKLLDEPMESFDHVVLRNILPTRFGVRIKASRQLLACHAFSPEDCTVLGVDEGAVGLILETFGIDVNDEPIYYQRVLIPANDYKLVIIEV